MAYLRGLSITLPLWGRPPAGYQGAGAEAPTLSEESEESETEGTSWDHSSLGVVVGSETGVGTPISTSYIPATGGPFSALIPSMWPQDILGQIQQTEDSGQHPECEYDEFGFRIEGEEIFKEKEDPDPLTFVTTEDPSIRLKWTAHLEFTQSHIAGDLTWDKVSSTLPKSEKLRELVYSGIPHSMRSHLWPRLSGGLAAKASCELSYRRIVRHGMKEESMATKQIEKDLCRTMPFNACFHSEEGIGIPKLRRILRGIAWLYPDIGYCQGMGVIISSLLLFLEEEDTFWVMVALIEGIVPSSYYSSTLIGVQADQRVLRQLIANYLPNLDQLLKNHDIELSLITLHWFLTALASVLQLKVLLRVWDVLFYEGSIALFRVVLGMLKLKEPFLLTLENSAQIFNALSDLPGDITDADEMLQYAQKASSSLTDVILETHRKKHITFLSNDLAKSSSHKHQINQPILRRTRASYKKSWLSMMYDIGYSIVAEQLCSATAKTAVSHAVKAKNIHQTELVAELKQSIQYIARHFNQGNNNKACLDVDYSIQSHAQDYENYINVARCKHRRARALIDFERHEDDELGFRKNDVITIISQKDEHCWIGELNGLRGWFPAKFVHVLDERSKDYSSMGDDSVTEAVTDLVRGHLCTALRNLFDHGMRSASLLGGACHPWRFIEEASQREVDRDFPSVFSRLVLCKTFRLDEDGKVLAPEELLYRAVQAINASHDASKFSMDVKFRSLVCYGLNEQVLHIWFELLCGSEDVVSKWYHRYSFLRSPAWIQIKCELRVLAQFPFSLSVDWEVKGKDDPSCNMKEDVQDMLVKHHLFSWDL